MLRRVWSDYFDFQRRFQAWQAAHQALLAGTVSAAAPEVAAFRSVTGEALAAGLALLREGRLTALQHFSVEVCHAAARVTLTALMPCLPTFRTHAT